MLLQEMSVELNAENRSTIVTVRCCSFCRRPGHNITRCDSSTIRNFEINTLEYINSNMSSERFDNTNRRQLRQYLLNEALNNSNLLRGFAISRCGASTRINLSSYIEIIIQYFMPEDEEPNQEEGLFPTPDSMQRLGSIELAIARRRIFQDAQSTLLYAVIFSEMNRAINNSSIKFNIKTSVLDKQLNLEQKCECNICYEEYEIKNFIKLNCGHEFCKDCIKQTLQNERRLTPCCAFCRTDIKHFELKLESIKNDFNELIKSEC